MNTQLTTNERNYLNEVFTKEQGKEDDTSY